TVLTGEEFIGASADIADAHALGRVANRRLLAAEQPGDHQFVPALVDAPAVLAGGVARTGVAVDDPVPTAPWCAKVPAATNCSIRSTGSLPERVQSKSRAISCCSFPA